jgi:hypothetical protein
VDKLVRHVTVIHGTRDDKSVAVYREPRRERNRARVSVLTWPLERGPGTWRSNRRRRDGWLLELPGNFAESSRKALNEARKAVLFVNLPKL